MIGYVMVGTNDLNDAANFYDPVLETLGLIRGITDAEYIGYGSIQSPKLIEFYLTNDGKQNKCVSRNDRNHTISNALKGAACSTRRKKVY